ncbi:MAG: hypothetical protein KDD22_03690, partial [Bdellovibrionales bacterium]|nr:hypothetical protein [Bdellovibrionales bacterium]
MRRMLMVLFLFAIIPSLLLSFQNCSGGFHSGSLTSQNARQSSNISDGENLISPRWTFNSQGKLLPLEVYFVESNEDKFSGFVKLEISGDSQTKQVLENKDLFYKFLEETPQRVAKDSEGTESYLLFLSTTHDQLLVIDDSDLLAEVKGLVNLVSPATVSDLQNLTILFVDNVL